MPSKTFKEISKRLDNITKNLSRQSNEIDQWGELEAMIREANQSMTQTAAHIRILQNTLENMGYKKPIKKEDN